MILSRNALGFRSVLTQRMFLISCLVYRYYSAYTHHMQCSTHIHSTPFNYSAWNWKIITFLFRWTIKVAKWNEWNYTMDKQTCALHDIQIKSNRAWKHTKWNECPILHFATVTWTHQWLWDFASNAHVIGFQVCACCARMSRVHISNILI